MYRNWKSKTVLKSEFKAERKKQREREGREEEKELRWKRGEEDLGGLIQEINRQLTWEDNNIKTAILQHCEHSTEEQWLLLKRIRSKVLHIPAIDLQKQTVGLIQYLFEVLLVLPRSAVLISKQPLPVRLQFNVRFHVELSGWPARGLYGVCIIPVATMRLCLLDEALRHHRVSFGSCDPCATWCTC